jgi:hypothetical protein
MEIRIIGNSKRISETNGTSYANFSLPYYLLASSWRCNLAEAQIQFEYNKLQHIFSG